MLGQIIPSKCKGSLKGAGGKIQAIYLGTGSTGTTICPSTKRKRRAI
jgi:hypothetical protein